MRKSRLLLPRDGTSYHIMARTAQQEKLLEDPTIKEWMYKYIAWLGSIYYVTLHSIAILDNHYHIVLSMRQQERDDKDLETRWNRAESVKRRVKPWEESRAEEWHRRLGDLSSFAKELNQMTATYVNHRNKKKGHLWGERFKSVLVEDGLGLLATMLYVELNPVRAGLCKSPREYRWCSTGRFHYGGASAAGVTVPKVQGFNLSGESQRQRAFDLYLQHLVLQKMGKESNYPHEIAELEKMVASYGVKDIGALVLRRTHWLTASLILGSKAFCKDIITRKNLRTSIDDDCEPFALPYGLYNQRKRGLKQEDPCLKMLALPG